MTRAGELRSGKGHRDENFPVASHLIAARHRAPILAFYEFVRVADDIADHAELTPDKKLALLDRLEASLLGDSEEDPEGVRLKRILAERSLSPRHAQDLIAAFRLDVNKLRYRDWDELIHYCSLSAMPVGRYVLDVHGESRSTWAASDAICAALQINNHLQDCKADYLTPRPRLRAARRADQLRHQRRSDRGARGLAAIARLPAPSRRPHGRLSCAKAPACRTRSAIFRLSLEISVIHTLAERIVQMLMLRDPLSEGVHLGKAAFAAHHVDRNRKGPAAPDGAARRHLMAEHQDA